MIEENDVKWYAYHKGDLVVKDCSTLQDCIEKAFDDYRTRYSFVQEELDAFRKMGIAEKRKELEQNDWKFEDELIKRSSNSNGK
jgi:hypothetical protein